MKMFLTRLGRNSKMIITGDLSQVDLPRGVTSGLRLAERILGDVEQIPFVYFDAQDIVRHPVVQLVVDAYARKEAQALERPQSHEQPSHAPVAPSPEAEQS